MADRSHPVSKARDGGREEPPSAQGQGRQPGGPTPRPRNGGSQTYDPSNFEHIKMVALAHEMLVYLLCGSMSQNQILFII